MTYATLIAVAVLVQPAVQMGVGDCLQAMHLSHEICPGSIQRFAVEMMYMKIPRKYFILHMFRGL